ncbi:aldose epimerase family protein [Sedimentitalea todarodis]|uniref:Aldose epimerase family protein n=1 Tax=Sedimentitalea todarodis TaxID=1631240 RepID=A0ABU3VER5_9RHOB|nr:aldose epimerase family protein [Sedimentitalea todarodis]MDU9004199.1 aldose epimerase family protein [Sedimentitalea todarodis]
MLTVGRTPDGRDVRQISLRGGGLTATVLTYGATLQSLRCDGHSHSLILGSPDFSAYLADMHHFGAIVGPVANRVAGGRFELDGITYRLDRNENAQNTLHGGSAGFHTRVWEVVDHGPAHCTLTITQADGLGGFPGDLQVSARYSLEDDHALRIDISGQAKAVALFNPAFHGYWNLDGSRDLSGHRLKIAANSYLPLDANLIPAGSPQPVQDTPFDYRFPRPPDPALDHNFCVAPRRGSLREVAQVTTSGHRLALETTEPGLQVYAAGQTTSGDWPGHDGIPYGCNAGIALEPQLWPNAPNRPDFPSARIEAGQQIVQTSRFRFALGAG